MIEKDNINQKSVDDNTTSTADKKTDTKPVVHNPFEDDGKEVSPEEIESLEQFKEAQTERD